ncbi:Variant surface glycoprotein [Trypanosoma congolense IL3000]|uniref:Variant surface glycoprotein n=1 Tax=Trypanosoma congolense (strain IL3000) TaxID=1068625 RepID=F9W8P9_TRYCI|nr:Variant surface glycoprotein [Trypanosoma congolense IL3000]
MACLMNGMAVVILILLGFVRGQTQVERDDNIEPFSLLCRIYNVAKNPPINYVDLQEPVQIVEEIDTLNKSLLKEQRHGEEEDSGNNSETQLPHTTSREAALLQLSLNQITQRAHKVLDEIKKMNVNDNIENTKAKFNQIIFGENGNESDLCHATVNDLGNRSEACGKPGPDTRGGSAGKNLVVDFFCLCVQRQDGEGINQVCGFYAGSGYKNGQLGWNDTGPWGSSTMWASIKGGCGKHMQQHPKSTAEARHILDQFLKHLNTGGVYRLGDTTRKDNAVEGSERKAGMLGTGVGKKDNSGKDILCDGKKGGKDQSPGGVCVYYGTESDSWETNILWLKPFKTVLTNVDAVNNQTASIQSAIKKLQTLLHRAEEIYETAKVITEINYPVVTTAVQNASANVTARNATRTRSYSYNRRRYFIQMVVVLLI